MADEESVRVNLRTAWHCTPIVITALVGGRSRCAGPGPQPPPDPFAQPCCWLVTCDTLRYLARWVPVADRASFEAGLSAAEHLVEHGISVCAPVRTVDGALTVPIGPGVVALLRWLPGRALRAFDEADQIWWGEALGRVHRALAGFEHAGLGRGHGIRPDAPHLNGVEWLRPAVGEAVAALTKLTITDQLTYGVLHGDPAPEGFLMDRDTGRTGLVGWRFVAAGPLVFDVAAAVAHAGGPARAADLLAAYAAVGPVPRDEIDAALPVLLRFHWAVRADRLALRLNALRV